MKTEHLHFQFPPCYFQGGGRFRLVPTFASVAILISLWPQAVRHSDQQDLGVSGYQPEDNRCHVPRAAREEGTQDALCPPRWRVEEKRPRLPSGKTPTATGTAGGHVSSAAWPGLCPQRHRGRAGPHICPTGTAATRRHASRSVAKPAACSLLPAPSGSTQTGVVWSCPRSRNCDPGLCGRVRPLSPPPSPPTPRRHGHLPNQRVLPRFRAPPALSLVGAVGSAHVLPRSLCF